MTAQDAYHPTELLAYAAAQMLEDNQSVFVGTGLPMIASMLAQRTHAPGILVVFEAGGIGPQVPVLPISVGDSRTFYRASAASSMHDVMSASQAGFMDVGFLGAAQIDPYGNLNTTVIGPWDDPKVRLPGSGGANDVGSLCWRTIIVMRQDPRRFVQKLDYLTTPGYLTGPGARERAGLPANTGPYRVITQLGIFGFHKQTRRMMLLATHPGTSVEEIRASSGFELQVSDNLVQTEPPSPEIRAILRDIDPTGMVVPR
jgi:acyl CoA:acetate/3-ketoacid CoA transferase beta subunit